MERTAVEWFNQKLVDRQNGNGDSISRDEIFEQAKEMERIQKIKIQIQENESILEMLRIHGSDASIIRVFSRLESLKEELTFN